MEINFNKEKCVHNGQCVGNLPAVFQVKDGQLVIIPDGASEQEIKQVVSSCPSGALTTQ